ncbi:MAG: Stp1/IreP family PP2C-type Ser/Thr phosphatase [Myxococcales bacterium]|nr:Stp1/IreP family PP2C-type Ser/Thr phosphatase [Myxococcales bacterium]
MSTEHLLHARTDVGRAREHNEDNFFCDRPMGLYVVADGMGGHAAGEVASAMAIQAVAATMQRARAQVEAFARGGEGAARAEDIRQLLGHAVSQANREVYAAAQASVERRGMGTTLTALLLVNDRAFIAHVGDSRVYVMRGGEVRQLTEDHSVVNELRRRGRLRPEVLSQIQHKNAVTRAIGVFENVEVDTYMFLAAPGDRFVLCSDGLHRYLDREQDLGPLLTDATEETASGRMINFALERGGADNVTVVVVTLPDASSRDRVVRELSEQYQALSGVPFFRHLEPRELLFLQATARLRDAIPGEAIVREGDAGDAMFVIVSGTCAVKKGDVEIARLKAGEHFGEMSLVESVPRSASVVADDDARLLAFARNDVFKVLRENKDLGMKLLWNIITALAGRLRETSTQLGEAREALAAEDLTAHLFLQENYATLPTHPPPRRSGDRDTLLDLDAEADAGATQELRFVPKMPEF